MIRQGRVVQTMPREGATKPRIAELMVGKPVLLEVERPPVTPGAAVLEVRDLRVKSPRGPLAVDGVSLDVHAGEIYGIAGVEGNGQSRAGAGDRGGRRHRVRRHPPGRPGHLPLDRAQAAGAGHRAHPRGPAEVRPAPLLLPGGEPRPRPAPQAALRDPARHRQLPGHPGIRPGDHPAVRHPHPVRGHPGPRPVGRQPAEGRGGAGAERRGRGSCSPPSPRAGWTSGPRSSSTGSSCKARSEGKAVLLVSADLDELLALSDRIGVMFKGRIIQEFTHDKAAREEVGLAHDRGSSRCSGLRRGSAGSPCSSRRRRSSGFSPRWWCSWPSSSSCARDPGKAFVAIYKFTLSTTAKFAAVVSISIPYFLSGLAVAIAFRAGVFNIGVEGQYFVGGLVGALAGIYLPLPPCAPRARGRPGGHGRRRAVGVRPGDPEGDPRHPRGHLHDHVQQHRPRARELPRERAAVRACRRG